MQLVWRWVGAACVATGVLAATAGRASADANIGVTLSATGAAASLGIPEKNTVALFAKGMVEIVGGKGKFAGE